MFETALQAEIDRLAAEFIEKHQIPGLSLAVVQDETPILVKGYGLANVEHAAPTTAETPFEIASITKLFTATAIMMLVEEGVLNLAEPIGNLLDDLPEAWRPISVRHILSHQSGIRSYTERPRYWETTKHDLSKQEILDLVAELPLDFEPGMRHAYDNTGYYLLGMIIEAVSGQTYEGFLRDKIFEPLGMESTQAKAPSRIVPGRAAGYTQVDGKLENVGYYSTSGTYSAGVLLSTASDMAKWSAALYSDILLSKPTRDLMWTPHLSTENNEAKNDFSVGLGWFLVGREGRRFAGHNGSVLGFASSTAHFLEIRLTVTMFCNMDVVPMPHELPLAIAELF